MKFMIVQDAGKWPEHVEYFLRGECSECVPGLISALEIPIGWDLGPDEQMQAQSDEATRCLLVRMMLCPHYNVPASEIEEARILRQQFFQPDVEDSNTGGEESHD